MIDILPYLFLGVVKECAKQRKIMREKEKKNFDKNRRNEKRDSFNDKKEKIFPMLKLPFQLTNDLFGKHTKTKLTVLREKVGYITMIK